MPGPVVERGERVTLRTVEEEDVPFVQRVHANPALRYPVGARLATRGAVEEWYLESDDDRFVVCREGGDVEPGKPDESDVRRLGVVTVEDADWKRPELTYWIVPEAQGEGYGSEAVALAVEYAFRAYDAAAVGAGAFAFNDASRGLLESLGFSEEGRRRKSMFVDGEHRDLVLYGLLREDWA